MRIRSSSSDRKKRERAGVALAAGAAAQLVVDAPALMPLGADHEQAAGVLHRARALRRSRRGSRRRAPRACRVGDRREFQLQPHLEIAAEFDVGAAAGHVGGDGDRARRAGLGDDRRFLLMEARIQHRVRAPSSCFSSSLMHLALLDAGGADQHRLAALARHSSISSATASYFSARRAIDLVVLVLARHRHVGRDFDHVAACRSRSNSSASVIAVPVMPASFGIQAEIILEGDGGEGLVLAAGR